MRNPDFKAVVIEASAGTGKTSRITREFFSILDKDNPAAMMRKILAVTFSEKAAIEMKMRILERIYADIYPVLSGSVKIDTENAMLKLRISTIHSFCHTLLKRFALYTGMDPFFTVIDERQSDLLYYRAFYNFLNSSASINMMPVLKNFKLNSLKDLLFAIRRSHPYTTAGIPEGSLSKTISEISLHISEIHSRMKKDLSMLDFNDLEILTYRLLTEYPESLTILEDFDEKNNYIFVDEFQDTNILQWKIVHKLAEEWLSGYGAKAEKGESYGLFLVGDRKQSIYKFRGAEGSVFDDARGVLRDYFLEEKLLRNYRSQQEILDFVNNIFLDTQPWTDQQLSTGQIEKSPCFIEINLLSGDENPEAKNAEYEWVLGRIMELIKKKESVRDKETGELRPIEFRDIAILMRKRVGNNFLLLEKKLKESGIPFVILGGIGFYNEQEIIFLLSLVFALADPTDKISLWNLHNSVYKISNEQVYGWRQMLSVEELTIVIESILEELNFWDRLSTQQKANTEKFLLLLQELEDLPLYQVSRSLRTMALSYEEPKADIFSEHQNAVRILTVHNAKGLEFPAVFLINIEDGRVMLKDKILYRKIMDAEIPYRFVLKKEADEEFKRFFKGMLEEEEERVLYVALTRAQQYLFISGVKNKRGSESSLWIKRLLRFETAFPPASVSSYTEVFTEEETKKEEKVEFLKEKKFPVLTSYTREKEQDYYRYERTIVGEIVHKILHEISEGKTRLEREAYENRMRFYLGKTNLVDTQETENFLMKIYENIVKNPEIKEIVENLPKGEAFSELPFIVEVEKGEIYTGSIDRIILKGEQDCHIYDYKLEGNEPERYRQQMEIYEKAVRKAFPDRPAIKKFIIFLRTSKVLSV